MINLASLTNWNFFYALPTYKISKRYIYNVFNIYIYIYGLAVSARALKLPPLQKSVYLRICVLRLSSIRKK